MIKKLIAKLIAYLMKPLWIDVNKALPESGQHVIVCFTNSNFWTGPMYADFFRHECKNGNVEIRWRIVDLWEDYDQTYNFVEIDPTHWMPIPRLPDRDKKPTHGIGV